MRKLAGPRLVHYPSATHPSGCARGGGWASMLQYVCKSCRLVVTREDCSGLLLHIGRRRRDGLIGSFNPSGHLAERATASTALSSSDSIPPPGAAVRRNYTNISFYINSVCPDVQIYNTSPPRSLKQSPCPRRGVTSIGRRFFSSPTPWYI